MLHRGDCNEVLKTLEANSIDALITDPPAGISFLGKDWDSGSNFIPAMTEIFKETLRCLKPGAHGLVWALPRTSHWTATALEDAGFEIRDVVTHLFGSGFPKSLDISKAIDKAAGVEREVIGKYCSPEGTTGINSKDDEFGFGMGDMKKRTISAPATDEAKQWEGWGTALKPASEHWILVRKPISEKTIAANVLKWGTGGINIDECRIGTDKRHPGNYVDYVGPARENCRTTGDHKELDRSIFDANQGRFPANLVLDEEAAAILDEQSGVLKTGGRESFGQKIEGVATNFGGQRKARTTAGDSGGASRFFYVAKASKKDRNEGLGGMPEILCGSAYGQTSSGKPSLVDDKGGPGAPNKWYAIHQNHHPTVKSTKLMEYLIKLITPPNGVILDPFMGSGSTGVAAKRLHFEFIGIEQNEEYFNIAQRRINVS